ncbi:hypothetical protein K488DRAFT_88511 [Vararia minispora EC-137]|uniref:Uncharacterized protein n=1 Tax=Vararia minispora EC-137 TaxID=1314806 RepID=A0ACB8QDI4_9AGAM|nr:hypothetical protein K488DRAFT_88511 [Vararia minispora EC-137]
MPTHSPVLVPASASSSSFHRHRSKRKLDQLHPQDPPKRPRPSDIQPVPLRRQVYPQRSDQVEEGELPDDLPPPTPAASRVPLPSPSTSSPPIENLPIARPRKRLRRDDPTFQQLHDRYFKYGRMLKYSGDCHYLASFSPSHKDYKPLANPPPPSDPYHQRSALLGRLELVDAIICFAYSLWAKDYSQNICNAESWRSLNSFLSSTKVRWQTDNTSELDRAFLGLIWMVEGFIHSRTLAYLQIETLPEFERLQRKTDQMVSASQANAQRTPPMLPSPASIAPASSANSTPTGRDAETPNASAAPPATRPPAPASSSTPGGRPQLDKAALREIAVPVSAHFSDKLQAISSTLHHAKLSMKYAQTHLTLRTLATHFPVTFQRILHSSLRQEDEPEPDMEDEAGELFWPGAPTTGEGIGWVCLMGKAMINEFGKTVGYRGYDGCVPKPGEGSSVPPASSSSSSSSSAASAHGDRR